MFEDAWLNDQESVIQQVVNGLFETAHSKIEPQYSRHQEKRRLLLQLYQGSECLLLHRKLQASLVYGALSPPKDWTVGKPNLATDMGLRQKFLTLWTRTYDLEKLMAVAEVVIGREVPISSLLPNSGGSRDDVYKTKSYQRSLESFLGSCLIRNEDAVDFEQSSSAGSWRRTVLRSMMMILLLDRAMRMNVISGNLFLPSSKYKSSHMVLIELSALLLPSVGDIHRPLSHLDYRVDWVQFPLSEYEYRIGNLATDLRDGVRLTHLVELLLYPPESLSHRNENITMTIPMPTVEVLTTTVEEGQSWPLSQHLKLPCMARTQKLYNVQIALSALRDIGGIRNTVHRLGAQDIVNGHREKTVALLWGLVGKWGLEKLVDFLDVKRETCRLSKDERSTNDGAATIDENDEALEGLEKHTHLLKTWAGTIARRNGLYPLNLSTSFADGKIFDKILDEYQLYLPESQLPNRDIGAGKSGQLDAKLKAIGCSASFGKWHPFVEVRR
ncbi:hypothetical protein MMC28_007802 [Mycoblastus sanguinarius]|nr:hypothetical protein [Mycoblastus sanguinarius]